MSQQINDGGPAFPTEIDTEHYDQPSTIHYSGMTLRDYFAAKAMQAYIDRDMLIPCKTDLEVSNEFLNTAAFSYRMADAMLEARE